MRNLLFIVFLLPCFFMAAQEGTLDLDQGFFGLTYYKGDQKVKVKDVENTLRKYPKLLARYNDGRGARNTATFFGGVAGFFIGWPIGQSMSENRFRRSTTPWWMVGVGAGFAAIAIPINNSGIKKMKSAFKDYNGHRFY